jgi:hypothetical protein
MDDTGWMVADGRSAGSGELPRLRGRAASSRLLPRALPPEPHKVPVLYRVSLGQTGANHGEREIGVRWLADAGNDSERDSDTNDDCC